MRREAGVIESWLYFLWNVIDCLRRVHSLREVDFDEAFFILKFLVFFSWSGEKTWEQWVYAIFYLIVG